MMWSIYEIIHIWTAVVDESEGWSSQLISNLSNWKEEAWKKIRASMGFEPVTSAIPVRCSANWAMKPHIGSKVNLLSSYLPWGVKWCEVYRLGFSSKQFQSYNKSLINQACSGPSRENIGPWSFLYRPCCARSILSRPWADILPVWPSCLVNKI